MQEGDKSFVTTPSGLRYLDLKPGTGVAPSPGQLCVVDWVGYTAGYQAKRIESTRETDEPYRFRLGKVIIYKDGAYTSVRLPYIPLLANATEFLGLTANPNLPSSVRLFVTAVGGSNRGV
jgi:hypothetical protein